MAANQTANPRRQGPQPRIRRGIREAQKALIQLRLRRESGELIKAADAETLITRIAGDMRAAFLEIPASVAARLELPDGGFEIVEAIVDQKLNEISARGQDGCKIPATDAAPQDDEAELEAAE